MPGRPTSISSIHIPNAQMTKVAIEYPVQSFISEQAAPALTVIKESDVYYKFKKSHLIPTNDERAINTKAKRIMWEIDSTPTYVCTEYTLESILADRIRDNQDPPIKSDITTVQNLVQVHLMNQEVRTKALYATRDAAGAAYIPNPLWNAALPTIEADIDAAMERIALSFGTAPNTIIMNETVYKVVKKDPTLRALWKYLPIPAEQVFSLEKMFALMFGINNFLVAGAVYNTANKGQTESLSRLWGENVYFAYLEPQPDLMRASFAYNINTKRKQISNRRDEDYDGTVYRVKSIQTEKVISSEACECLPSVLA